MKAQHKKILMTAAIAVVAVAVVKNAPVLREYGRRYL